MSSPLTPKRKHNQSEQTAPDIALFAEEPKTKLGQCANLLFGRPLASYEDRAESVNPATGIPIFGLDALSSAAYGPEAALTVLIPLGAMGIVYLVPLTGAIIILLAIVFFSYIQTIGAYPNGGGSYTVATENLGVHTGLLAACALLTDYVLEVAVGISAGVGALVSAVPSLEKHMLLICLVVLVLLTIVNLRGARSSGVLFMVPTYWFVVTMLIVIGIGIYKVIASHGHPVAVFTPPPMLKATEVFGIWILLRAFANGCTALTGVEAVSNGVRAFSEPRQRNARITLCAVIFLLIILLAGVAYLAHAYHLMARPPGVVGYQSLLSLIIGAVIGRGIFYYATIAGVLLVLVLSANTGFADFPRVCHAIAHNRYLPYIFIARGRRLVYSWGIYVLFACTAVLLIVFDGVTDRLIPLFAIGAFTAFTLSQAGMVRHWLRNKQKGWRVSIFLNGLGAVATGITTIIVLITKFRDGAWITVLLIAALMVSMLAVKRHYDFVSKEICDMEPLAAHKLSPPLVVLPVLGWNTITSNALNFAMSISPRVHAVHVETEDDEEHSNAIAADWDKHVTQPATKAGLPVPEFVLLPSPYRTVIPPLLAYILKYQKQRPHDRVAVVLPELVEQKWYQYFLHNQRATVLKALLYLRGNRNVVVINVPWYIDKPSKNKVN